MFVYSVGLIPSKFYEVLGEKNEQGFKSLLPTVLLQICGSVLVCWRSEYSFRHPSGYITSHHRQPKLTARRGGLGSRDLIKECMGTSVSSQTLHSNWCIQIPCTNQSEVLEFGLVAQFPASVQARGCGSESENN